VLTVSKDASVGGQYRTISEALREVKPGMTIRVLDEGPYREQIFIDDRHEATTLETTVNTVLELTESTELIRIDRVSNVSIRGFRIRASDIIVKDLDSQRDQPAVLVSVVGDCSGLMFDQVEMDTTRKGSYVGFLVNGGYSSNQDEPIVIRRCKVRRAFLAIVLNGTAGHIQRLVIGDNVFEAATNVGIDAVGSVSNVQIVSNQFIFSDGAAVGVANLDDISENVLLANNTFLGNVIGLAVSDDAPAGQNIHVRNNLFLASKTRDMTFIDGMKAESGTPLQAQDGKLLHDKWHVGENWREGDLPVGNTVFDRGWIPPTATDVCNEKIEGITRDPNDIDNFLRPAKDSELANAGAGKTEPSLPSYVGALPPRGVERWDWSRTWQAPPGTSELLTVSQNANDGGQFRTIDDALQAAKPWATIRVLDSEVYREPVFLDNSDQFLGVMLESRQGATLELAEAMSQAILIDNAQQVRVRGFQFRDSQPAFGSPFIKVSGKCADVVLDGLTFTNDPNSAIYGVVLDRVRAPSRKTSVVVRNCRFDMSTPSTADTGCGAAILIMGSPSAEESVAGGMLIVGNRISGTLRAIHFVHSCEDALIAGNVIWDGVQEGIGFEDWGTRLDNVVVVNNTLFGCPWLVRLWDTGPVETLATGQAEIRSNVLFDARATDIGFCYISPEAPAGTFNAGEVQELIRNWHIADNFRDGSGTSTLGLVPSDNDRPFERNCFVSRIPSHDEFLRPVGDSELATGGAGNDLPSYAGALPPGGVELWDWGVTWRNRSRRGAITNTEDEHTGQN
jgi:hypothetical protein